MLALRNGLVDVDTEKHSSVCSVQRGNSQTSTNESEKEYSRWDAVKIVHEGVFSLFSYNKFKPYFHISRPICVWERSQTESISLLWHRQTQHFQEPFGRWRMLYITTVILLCLLRPNRSNSNLLSLLNGSECCVHLLRCELVLTGTECGKLEDKLSCKVRSLALAQIRVKLRTCGGVHADTCIWGLYFSLCSALCCSAPHEFIIFLPVFA